MTRREKFEYENMPTVAYYSGYGGIEIKEVQYGIEDYIVYVANSFLPTRSVHRSKIYTTTSGRLYFKYHTLSIYCDECIRN